MKYRRLFAIAAGFLFSITSVSAQHKNAPSSTIAASMKTVEGLVRDVSCPVQNKEATATNFNLQCALECAKGGSPLIILSKEGVIYIPISNEMPDKDQRQRLMPFVGKYVKATGKVYQRGETHAIAIEDIQEMKGVQLTTDAK